MKYFQIPVNAINLEKFPLFTPKDHPRVCWVVWIILQLQRTVIEDTRVDTINMINTIDTIDRIDCINQYKDNWWDLYDQLTLQNSPTQWNHCYILFRFSWLIKVKIIVVLQYSVILLVRSHLLHLFILFATQSYGGTHSRGETALPIRNGLLLCISRSDVSSCIYPTDITLLLCSRRYQLQQVGSDNHVKCHSQWWSSNQWCSPFDLVVW